MIQEITDANFQQVVAEGSPLVIDFWATWCGPCRMLGPVVDEIANEYEGKVRVGKLNVDENPNTCEQFGIMSIPTLLFFKNGELVDRTVGALGKAEIKRHFDSLI